VRRSPNWVKSEAALRHDNKSSIIIREIFILLPVNSNGKLDYIYIYIYSFFFFLFFFGGKKYKLYS
jgi:hypothetical protein